MIVNRADSRIAPSQWGTSFQSNAVFHWLGANLESALVIDNMKQWNHIDDTIQGRVTPVRAARGKCVLFVLTF